jgi:ATP-dependent Clp protease, protease subunit
MRALKDGIGFELRRRSASGAILNSAEEPAGSAEILLYDVIGEDMFGGISSRAVAEKVAALGPVPLDVRINSPGGLVYEGIAIYNLLVRHPAPVTVHVDAIAASIASVVAMAGDEVRIAASAQMMIHRAEGIIFGSAEAMRSMVAQLEKADASIFGVYAQRTGRKAATFLQKVKDSGGEWFLTADEAVKEGLADKVVKAEKVSAVLDERLRNVPKELLEGNPVKVPPAAGAARSAAASAVEEPLPPRRKREEQPGNAAALQVEDMRRRLALVKASS